MKIIGTIKVDFPEYAVEYLEYGERDQLTDEEVASVDAFLADLSRRGYTRHYITDDRNEFCAYPAFGLACATVKVRFFKMAEGGAR